MSPRCSAVGLGALDAVATTFRLLTCEPRPLAIDGAVFAGLPDRPIPLHELRDLLLKKAVDRGTCDAIWAQLIERARGDDPAWVVGAAGVALPGLRSVVSVLAPDCPPSSIGDLDSEVLSGFLQELRSIPTRWKWLPFRLRRAAYDAGVAFLTTERRDAAYATGGDVADLGDVLMLPTCGHPELLLADAVTAGTLLPRDAELIARSRLERTPLTELSTEWGVPYSTLRRWRTRAELRLIAALHTTQPVDHERPKDPHRAIR